MSRLTIKLSRHGLTAEFLTYLIVLISLFLTFFSYNKVSFGVEAVLLTVVILLLNFRRNNFFDLIPFVGICGFVVLSFLFSGQTGIRGFNAPVNHMLKFVYLMYVVALFIGMRSISKVHREKVIIWTLISVLISVFISAYSALFIDKYAIRYPDSYGFTNVVDFSQFYGICIILCALVFVILHYRKKFSVIKQVLFCIPVLICIGVSLYATGVFITVFGICLGVALHIYDKSKTNAIVCALFLIFLMFLVFCFRTQISDWIYKVTESLNWIIKDRIRSVADTIFNTDHNLAYSYDRRDELAGYSLTSFQNHPLFGVGYKEYSYEVIGGHQEWQDLLGVFGIVGALVFICAMAFLVRIVSKNIDNKADLHAFYICLCLFVILGFLNPCLNLPVLAAVFIIAPNISMVIPWWKDSEHTIKNSFKGD